MTDCEFTPSNNAPGVARKAVQTLESLNQLQGRA